MAIADKEFERLADAVAARLLRRGGTRASDAANSDATTAAIDRLANVVARRFVELTEVHPAEVAARTAAADEAIPDDLAAVAQRLLAELGPRSQEEIPLEKLEI